MSIRLGDRVKDKVTGLEGVVIGVSEWLYGCRRISIQPQQAKDGAPAPMFCIDEPQCELMEGQFIRGYEAPGVAGPAGPRPDAVPAPVGRQR